VDKALETALQIELRLMADCQGRCARQRKLIERLRDEGHDTQRAFEVMELLERSLTATSTHLDGLQKRQARAS